MNTILPTDEMTEYENRVYSNPQVGLDESSAFIDNLRTSQGQQNQEIFQQTENLGTDISSNLGGLTGGESYFTSRFQTPQTNAATANLRATAQAAALNEVLANQEAMWKKRYNDAYKAYQKRTSGGGGGDGDDGNSSTWGGEPKTQSTGDGSTDGSTEGEGEGGTTPPNPYSDEYNITGEEQTERISERSGLPQWLVNILKIMTNP